MKLPATFLFEFTLHSQELKKMNYEDRHRLKDLSRYESTFAEYHTYVFFLSDIHKIREVLKKYNIELRFPKRAEVKNYGLSYSKLSLEITAQTDSFRVEQHYYDRVETHIIPKKRVFRIYYLLKEFNRPVEPAELWERICKDFNLNRYFDRSGRFHKNSFLGDRRTYFDFYYYPIKVLEHIGKIRYDKTLEVI